LKILLVGFGALGMRHLQSIEGIDAKIDVIEISQENILENSKSISKKNLKKISFHEDYKHLENYYDVCIISTSSGPRLKIIKKLQDVCSWKFLILEKFLFPDEGHYVDFEDSYKFEINNVYVNCPRRYYGDYQNIKNLNNTNDFKSLEVYGNNWGMCTNGIHFLDLHRFLSDKDLTSVSVKNVRKKKSKRQGYDEIAGNLLFSSDTTKLELTSEDCMREESLKIRIIYSNNTYEIDEIGLKIISKQGNRIKKDIFNPIFQSNLTQRYLEDLMDSNCIKLTKYLDSQKDHLMFLRALNRDLSIQIT